MNSTTRRSGFSWWILALTCCFLTGCVSPRFNREWKQAASHPNPTNAITGRWQGHWASEVNLHRGELRCIVTQISETEYQFLYHARFMMLFQGSYTVTNEVQRIGPTFKMTGESDLGRLFGGKFAYDGEATPTDFTSAYRSSSDHGVFKMSRPQP